MSTRLILNADDFGLTRGINRAIAELYDAGALTSATLMATGPAFDHAVELARARPGLGVGCHIVLTDGTAVSDPRSIPSLVVGGGNTLRPKLLSFLSAVLGNQVDASDIEREATAQIRRLQDAGLTVTHIDTHKHTHILPPVLAPLLRAMARTGVRALRNPFEQPWAFPLSNGSAARTSQIRLVQVFKRRFTHQPAMLSGLVRTTDGTIGVSATGSLDEQTLRNLLGALPEGTWELVCHPGYNDAELDRIPTRLRSSRDIEREALLRIFSKPPNSQVGELVDHPAHESADQRDATAAAASPTSSGNNPQLSLPQLIHYGSLT